MPLSSLRSPRRPILFYAYTIDNQAIVIPETIDAVRALGRADVAAMESIALTGTTLGHRPAFRTYRLRSQAMSNAEHALPATHRAGEPEASRRHLAQAAACVGGAGVLAGSVPFVLSFAPSERARAMGAPVSASIAGLQEEKLMTIEWRGRPVWILRRSLAQQQSLQSRELHARLADPMSRRVEQQPPYAANPSRSIRPDIGVLVGLCTHLGCIPSYRPEVGAPDLPEGWPGGFYCPCHGSSFDLAGRVYRNVPAPANLLVPPHQYVSDSVIEIGVDSSAPTA